MREAVTSRIMARTTINLDATVLRELKARRERERRPIGDVASDLLAAALKERPSAVPESPEFRWKSYDLGGYQVDLYDKEAVWRALDG